MGEGGGEERERVLQELGRGGGGEGAADWVREEGVEDLQYVVG